MIFNNTILEKWYRFVSLAALGSSFCLIQVVEAELLYRDCVRDAKLHQEELVKAKERIISHIRKLICQGDTVLKEVGMKLRKLNICLPVSMLLDKLFSAAVCGHTWILGCGINVGHVVILCISVTKWISTQYFVYVYMYVYYTYDL